MGMVLEKLQRLGMAAAYDSCGGTKEKAFRDYGIPYEYQGFIYNCTQSSENVFIRGMASGARGQSRPRAEKGKSLYERSEVSEAERKGAREMMSSMSPATGKERLDKANKCLLVKVLQDNACMHDCKYCVNTTCKQQKVSLEPEELAGSFMQLYKQGYTTGLFLSSAVHGSPEQSTEKMVSSAKLLRERGYGGYIHMKVLPETPDYLIREMALYANRLSVNLEAATTQGFAELTSTKNYKEGILRRVRTLDKVKREADRQRGSSGAGGWFCDSRDVENGKDYRVRSFTTQIILGANEETDRDVVGRMDSLYEETSLYRTYFSAFSPVEGTPLAGKDSESKTREHRLYEVDWLMRIYGFERKTIESGLGEKGNFALGHDVKQSIAINNSRLFPLDLNSCTREELLMVPGFGPKTADKVVEIREKRPIREFSELEAVGMPRT